MSASPFHQLKSRIGLAILLAALSAIHAIIIHRLGYEWKTAILDSVISNGMLAFLSIATINGLRFYLPEKFAWVYAVLWSAVLSVIGLVLIRWMLLQSVDSYESFIMESISYRWVLIILILQVMALWTVSFRQSEREAEQKTRKEETNRLAIDAELFKLRHQLQPHFLFNSLNSISSLIGSRPEDARNMIHQLSEFLRGTLKKEDHQLVSLEEELHYLDLYLSIEKVRFGHRLQTEILKDESVLSQKLPAMLLQPLVENAIKFGLYDTTDAVSIRIESKLADKMLILSVQNPFDAETVRAVQRNGFGLASIQRRLYLLYGRNDLLNTSTEHNIFIATIKIPQS